MDGGEVRAAVMSAYPYKACILPDSLCSQGFLYAGVKECATL